MIVDIRIILITSKETDCGYSDEYTQAKKMECPEKFTAMHIQLREWNNIKKSLIESD